MISGDEDEGAGAATGGEMPELGGSPFKVK